MENISSRLESERNIMDDEDTINSVSLNKTMGSYWDSKTQDLIPEAVNVYGEFFLRNFKKIVEVVVNESPYENLTVEILMTSNSRKPEIIDARGMVCAYIKENFAKPVSLKKLGMLFGSGKDHATILNSYRCHKDYATPTFNVSRTKFFYGDKKYALWYQRVLTHFLENQILVGLKKKDGFIDPLDLHTINLRVFVQILKRNGIKIKSLKYLPYQIKPFI